MSTKLTKKQKKAAAFRGKKGGGREEPQDVPIMDDPIDDGFGLDLSADRLQSQEGKADSEAAVEIPATAPSKKRKRESDIVETGKPPSKKMKLPATKEEATAKSKEKQKKQTAAPRYILFVGNLSYKTTLEAIAEHFSACDPPPTIRRLTSRGKGSNSAQPEKSKGCAFLEFTKASGLQNALRLHHSELDGRKINVELSAGGGGKSEARLKKLKEKNSKLDKHRVDANEEGRGDEDELQQTQTKPARARHSSTSGTKIVPQHKLTWSVSKAGEAPGRGGQKHRKPARTDGKRRSDREKRPSNAWVMSGANSIPVG